MARKLFQNPARVQNEMSKWFHGGVAVGVTAELAANHLVTGEGAKERLGRGALHLVALASLGSIVLSTADYNFAAGQIAAESHATRRLPSAPQF